MKLANAVAVAFLAGLIVGGLCSVLAFLLPVVTS